MSCENVQERISLLLDRQLEADERGNVLAHLETCRQCETHLESIQSMRAGLRRMATADAPAALSSKLRVLASHERARQLTHKNLSSRCKHYAARVRLAFDNMMRPFAVPALGGVLSALVMFGLLVPSLSFRHNFGLEPPTWVFTDPDGRIVGAVGYIPRLVPVSEVIPNKEPVLELTIDEQGLVTDFAVLNGELTQDMAILMLESKFTPATIFGQPTRGKVQVVFPFYPRAHGLRS
jgi:hypothetical protein